MAFPIGIYFNVVLLQQTFHSCKGKHMTSNQTSVHFERILHKRYEEVWQHQSVLQNELITKRRLAKAAGIQDFRQDHHYILVCEHDPVYTLGKSGSMDHLLLNDEELAGNQIEFFKINRGGDITYHGPGQITAYPILDLEEFATDVHLYVRNLEEVIIRTIADYGLNGFRIKDYTGVWLGEEGNLRKICAIGVHMSRWVTMHGLAFNVNTDLTYFDKIVPCGISEEDKSVTSLAAELGTEADIDEVIMKMLDHFEHVFGFKVVNKIIPTHINT